MKGPDQFFNKNISFTSQQLQQQHASNILVMFLVFEIFHAYLLVKKKLFSRVTPYGSFLELGIQIGTAG